MGEIKLTLKSCTDLNYFNAGEQDLMQLAAEDDLEALKELKRRGAFKKPVKG